MSMCFPRLAIAAVVSLVAVTGCASVLTGRVVIADSDPPAPPVAATILVEPVSRLPMPGRRHLETMTPPSLRAELVCDEDGAFELRSLVDEAGVSTPLQRGWSYEVRAEALGYFSTAERVDLSGRSADVQLRIHPIEEVSMDGEVIEGDANKRHDGLEGGLLDEILRRQGRLPGGR
jgi:hypothetical protein